MIVLLTGLALAAPPAPELLEDLDRWQAGADALLDGPPGCWQITGELTQTVVLHGAPDRFSVASDRTLRASGPFTAQLDEGTWTDFSWKPTQADEDWELDLDPAPLVGRPMVTEEEGGDLSISLGSDGSQVSGGVKESVNVIREAVDRFSGAVEVQWAQWDEAASTVHYRREVPVSDRARSDLILVTSHFPGGGERATRIDAVWPRAVKIGQWPVRVTFRDAQMHLQGYDTGAVVVPHVESLSMTAGVLGFTVGFEQQIQYRTATPCESPAPTAGP